MNKIKIGILYLCSGKYSVFWKEFYESMEENFIVDAEKVYYVFTDSKKLPYRKNENVKIIYQKALGWPDNSLLRFHMFYNHKEELKKYDFLFFFNANLKVVSKIGKDFLPETENLLVVKHPSYYLMDDINQFPYCRNARSTAYIPYGHGSIYVQGALNGGKTESFLELIEALRENVEVDKKNRVEADWYDESQLNWYIKDRSDLKVLGPEFIYPEGAELGMLPRILSRDKKKYFNVDKIKMKRKDYIITRVKAIMKKV